MAQTDNFLKIDIPGESEDSQKKGWFDLLDFDLDVSQAGSMAFGGGGGTGQAHFGNIPIETFVGKSTPELMLKCATGKHFPKAEIVCRKAGDKPIEYLKVVLTDVMITSYRMRPGTGGAMSRERWGLDYAKIELSYQHQNKDGSPGGWVTKWYNVKTNENG